MRNAAAAESSLSVSGKFGDYPPVTQRTQYATFTAKRCSGFLKNIQSDNTCRVVVTYASSMRFMLEVAGNSGQLSCNVAHLLALADAAVINNYPLLSGDSPPNWDGAAVLYKRYMSTVYCFVLYMM